MNEDKILQLIQKLEGDFNNLSGQVTALTLIISEMENLPKDKKEIIQKKISEIFISPLLNGNFRSSASATLEKILK